MKQTCYLAQHVPAGSGGTARGQLASHRNAIPIYLMAIFMDWALQCPLAVL